MSSQPVSRRLSAAPTSAPTAKLHESRLGAWTEVGDRCVFNHVTLGDYSYVERDCDLMFTEIGRFTSIASSVRINPSNHPWWRPTLHHFSYRPGKFGFAGSDQGVDDRIFDWRAEDRVVIGHDVWIGHGAIVLPGVTIGNGATIAAGSTITREVKEDELAIGRSRQVVKQGWQRPRKAPKS